MVSLGVGILFGFGAPARAPALAPPQRLWAQLTLKNGQRVGINRPDLQFDSVGREYTLEEDRRERVL